MPMIKVPDIFSEERRVENGTKSKPFLTKRNNKLAWTMTTVCTILFLLALFLALILGYFLLKKAPPPAASGEHQPAGHNELLKEDVRKKSVVWPAPTGSYLGSYSKTAVASDHGLCSEIARDVQVKGGNAVDATIAALFCVGVVNAQSSGIGGGFFMTIYNRTTQKCTVIDAREVAPSAATEDMFVGNPETAMVGYKAIAVPGELHGYWTAFKRFGSGKIAWKDLIEPTIDICVQGHPVSRYMHTVLKVKQQHILKQNSSLQIFLNKETGEIYKEGEMLKRPDLALTLYRIAEAEDPVHLFYRGEMADTIVQEMQQFDGLINKEDLSSYRTIVHDEPLLNDHLPNDLAMCGPPPPSSFAVTQLIVSLMAEFYAKTDKRGDILDDSLTYHRLIESMKFAYAKRSDLADPAFIREALQIAQNMTSVPYTKWLKSLIRDDTTLNISDYAPTPIWLPGDHGTSHVSAIDSQGNAVSATSTINRWFGSLMQSPRLGIFWNDEMDDFSTPGQENTFLYAPSVANYIQSRKRPMSSMSPAVVFDKSNGKVRLVFGASGGSSIISASAQTAIWTLFFNQTVKEAIDRPRLHNQFLPHETTYEDDFPLAIVNDLIGRGQKMRSIRNRPSTVQAISVAQNGIIYGNSDYRRLTPAYSIGY